MSLGALFTFAALLVWLPEACMLVLLALRLLGRTSLRAGQSITHTRFVPQDRAPLRPKQDTAVLPAAPPRGRGDEPTSAGLEEPL